MLQPSFLLKLATIRNQGKKIVLVTGVFDLLHQEHIHFLHKAKELGDFLVVAIESDLRVRQMKGEGRPIQSQDMRLQQIQQLGFIDMVFILPENFSRPSDHEELISEIRPTFLAVSSHTAHLEEKERILNKYGGQVKVVLQQNPQVSTTILSGK